MGCYSGPTRYRAPGYIEGTGLAFAFLANKFYSFESVYDFATMEHSYFASDGYTLSDFGLGASASQYAGIVWGLRTDSSIVNDYGGRTVTGYVGLSVDIGIGISGGVNGFQSITDPKIYGITYYLSGSLGLDAVNWMDVGVGRIDAYQFGRTTSYRTNSKLKGFLFGNSQTIDEGRLYLDILRGTHNAWLVTSTGSTGIPDVGAAVALGSRMKALSMAMHYARVYKELQPDVND